MISSSCLIRFLGHSLKKKKSEFQTRIRIKMNEKATEQVESEVRYSLLPILCIFGCGSHVVGVRMPLFFPDKGCSFVITPICCIQHRYALLVMQCAK